MNKLVSLAKRGWIIPVICAVVLSLAAGVVLAAVAFNHHGTANVVPTGGGGGPGGLTYDFTVNSDAAGAVPLTDADLALGDVLRGQTVTKHVYLKNTGTAPTFGVTIAGTGSAGVTVGVQSPVTLGATVVDVPIDIVFADNVTFGAATFDLSFTLAP